MASPLVRLLRHPTAQIRSCHGRLVPVAKLAGLAGSARRSAAGLLELCQQPGEAPKADDDK